MNKCRKLGKLFSTGIVTAAMAMSTFGTALAADTVDVYGSPATEYGMGANDVVENYSLTIGNGGDARDVTVAVPSAADRCSLRVYGISPVYSYDEDGQVIEGSADYSGITVKAYHLVEGNYNRYGFTGWTQTAATADIIGGRFESFNNVVNNVSQVVAVDNYKYIKEDGTKTNEKSDTTVDNPDYNKGLVITEENVSTIARAIAKDRNLVESVELEVDPNGIFKTDLAEAGTYLILVESNRAGVIYNPMIVSNDYSNANDSQSLSNVTATYGTENNNNVDMIDGQFVQHHDLMGGKGVEYNTPDDDDFDPDNFNKFTDYGFSLDATKVSGLLTTEDKDNLPDKQDHERYTESREVVSYVRDVEANGNVYAIGTLNGDGEFVPNENAVKTMALLGRAYAKKSTIGLEKNIVFASTDEFDDQQYDDEHMILSETNKFYYSKYDDASKGDLLTFDIMTAIPDYSNIYFSDEDDFVFELVDNQSDGLDEVDLETVKVYAGVSVQTNAEDIAAEIVDEDNLLTADTEYTIEAVDGKNAFKISFDKDWVLDVENANKKVVVRYSTTMSDDAKLGLDGNENEVFLNYTTAPNTAQGEEGWQRGYKFDFAMEYTFAPTVYKIGEEGELEAIDETTAEATADEQAVLIENTEVENPLAGAKFKLVRIGNRAGAANDGTHTANLLGDEKENIDSEELWNSNKYDELDTWYLTSGDDGLLTFDSAKDGIDEGLYALVEYEAPKGYTLNDRVYFIDITPTYDDTLKSFVGVDVVVADENETLGMAFLDGRHYEKKEDKSGELDEAERLLTSYEIDQWCGDIGTVDASVNPQDTIFKAETVFSWTEDGEKNIETKDMFAIPNTKLTRLPSTGGIGTLIFSLIGVSVMGGVVFVAMKKKKEEE